MSPDTLTDGAWIVDNGIQVWQPTPRPIVCDRCQARDGERCQSRSGKPTNDHIDRRSS